MEAVEEVKRGTGKIALIQGTLGRQGNIKIVQVGRFSHVLVLLYTV